MTGRLSVLALVLAAVLAHPSSAVAQTKEQQLAAARAFLDSAQTEQAVTLLERTVESLVADDSDALQCAVFTELAAAHL